MSREHSVFARIGAPYTTETLASAFIADTDEDREAVVPLIAMASGQLIAAGHPSAWHRFDPSRFFVALTATRHERVGMGIRLLGFFHWLWLKGLVHVIHADAISQRILAAAPTAVLLSDLHAALAADRADWARNELPN